MLLLLSCNMRMSNASRSMPYAFSATNFADYDLPLASLSPAFLNFRSFGTSFSKTPGKVISPGVFEDDVAMQLQRILRNAGGALSVRRSGVRNFAEILMGAKVLDGKKGEFSPDLPHMSTGKIFVTGGAGFIGSYVVNELLRNGYMVRCMIRSTTNTRRIDELNYEKLIGDIRDQQSLMEGAKGCTGIIHLAGLSAWKDIKSPHMPEVVIKGSVNVFNAAREAGNIKTVFVSSCTAINGTDEIEILDENSPLTLPRNKQFVYAWSKKEVEQEAMQRAKKGQPITIVNPTEVYGPFDYDKIACGNLIDFATTKSLLLSKGGTSIVHVEDVAKGIVAALEKGRSGERYILGSDNLQLEELAMMTLDILGIQKPIKMISRSLLLKLAWVSKTFRINMGFEPAVIPYAVKYWFMDNNKARNELSITFRSAREILEPTLKWVKEEGMLK